MCDVLATGTGGVAVTPTGVAYYLDTPAGHAAMARDMERTMGPGAGEADQPPVEEGEPPTDCESYTDAMWDQPCSKHFKFSHMKAKPTASGNLTPAQVACNWQKLCQNVLDPIVDAGYRITVSSGFRPAAANARIGGSNASDHLYGRAADIQLLGGGDAVGGAKNVFKFIGGSGLPYSQVIYEGRWVHVAHGGTSPSSVAVLVTRTGTAPYQNGGGRSGAALPSDLRWA